MLFSLFFYVFSIFLAYFDCKRFLVPNDLTYPLFALLLLFGYIESQINVYSIIILFTVLIFFVIIILINRTMILGGGDIKYMMLVALYLPPLLFPLFLLFTGIIQTLFLIFFQKFKRRRVAPMVPAMFIAVILCEIAFKLGVYP